MSIIDSLLSVPAVIEVASGSLLGVHAVQRSDDWVEAAVLGLVLGPLAPFIADTMASGPLASARLERPEVRRLKRWQRRIR